MFAELKDAGVPARALNLGGQRNGVRALRALVGHMRRMRPDVVVVRGYNAEVLGRIAARLAGVKHTILWVHDIGDIEPRSRIRNLSGRALLPSTSRFFGVAEAQWPHITGGLHCPAEKVRIIHNGVDPGLFRVEDDRSLLSEFGFGVDDLVVGIVAGLRPEKDHATLLTATRMLVSDFPNAKVLIVGDGPTRPILEALCDDLEISDHVHFAGSRSDVDRILRAIDVFVLCSVTECFPISVLEAMACARPVVCTDVGGVGEMVEHGVTGYLVPPSEPGELSDRLRDLLSNAELVRRLGQAGRRRVESEFTLESSIAEAERAIGEVVGR